VCEPFLDCGISVWVMWCQCGIAGLVYVLGFNIVSLHFALCVFIKHVFQFFPPISACLRLLMDVQIAPLQAKVRTECLHMFCMYVYRECYCESVVEMIKTLKHTQCQPNPTAMSEGEFPFHELR
jgi:hypothetical protein